MQKTKTKKCQPTAWVDKFQDYLVRGTYVLGSCLIVYSLLMFNGLLANDAKTPGNSFVAVSANGIAYAITDIWYATVFFMDDTGYKMGEPLNETINLYQRGLAEVFVVTGNFLSQIPEVLSTPPYARAKTH